VGLASGVLDDILVRDPVHATDIGDHRFDGRLADYTPDGPMTARVLQRHQQFLTARDRALSRFAAADPARGSRPAGVRLTVLRRHEWDLLLWNPCRCVYPRRLARLPASVWHAVGGSACWPSPSLDNARHMSGMPAIHVTTAISQPGQIGPMLAETADDPVAERGVVTPQKPPRRRWPANSLVGQQPGAATVPAAIGPNCTRA
jgi:hypothetical protein